MKISKCFEISGHSGAVYSLAYNQNFIYSASADKYVTRWNVTSGEQDKFAIKFDHSIYALCILDDDKTLITGLSNGDLHFFNLKERKEFKYFQLHKVAVFNIAQDPQTKNILVTDADGNLSVWDSITFKLLTIQPLNCGKIRRVVFNNADSTLLLCCQDGTIRLLDRITFNEVKQIFTHKLGCTSACILFNGISYTGGKDAYIRKWDENFNLLKEIPAHNYAVYELLCMNQAIVSASRDKMIKVWTEDLDPLVRIDLKKGGHRHSVNTLVKIDDSKFASASDDGKIIIWEIEH